MQKKSNLTLLAGILIGLLVTVGCKPIIVNEQSELSTFYTISSNQLIGQTFVSRFDGLSSIQVFLKPHVINCDSGNLILRIYPSPISQKILAEKITPISKITNEGYYDFPFEKIQRSKGNTYFVEFFADSDCFVDIASAHYQSYINGALYINHAPLDAQISFRLGYDPSHLIAGLILESMKWLAIFGIIFFLFTLPGYALLNIFSPEIIENHWTVNLAASCSTGLVIYPILVLWLDRLGFPLAIFTFLPAIFSLMYLLWKRAFKLRDVQFRLPSLETTLFLFTIGLVFITRLWVIRSLSAPMWGDSVQHAAMTQLFLDNDGLFTSWMPYAPYQSLTVQFNFSLLSAIFAWLTKSSASNATLWMGQIINFIAILALYPLTVKISHGNRLAGCIAMIIAGLFSPMPAYYVNWGRYAQLTGQAILPIAIFITWQIVESRDNPTTHFSKKIDNQINKLLMNIGQYFLWIIRISVLPAIIIAGMTLSYYRMPYFFAVFFPSWIFLFFVENKFKSLSQQLLPTLLVSILIALFIVSPWLSNLQGSTLANALENSLNRSSSWSLILESYRPWLDISSYLPMFSIWFIPLAGIIAVWKKERSLLAIILWLIFLFLLPAGGIFHIPGIGFINSFSVLIALYIPVSIVLGWIISLLFDLIPTHWKRPAYFVLTLIAAFGALRARSIANPDVYALVTKPDLVAFNWVERKTPPEARFLVEGYRIYDGKSIVGSDAGWWLPIFTKRQNTIPPQYALLTEKPLDPSQNQEMIDLVAALEETSLNSQPGFEILCNNRITHIYIGQRRGNIGEGVKILYKPEDLQNSTWYHLVYHIDGVYIFRLNRNLCP